MPIWYLSGRRKAVWPWQDSGWCPDTSEKLPPQEAVYPKWSFLMITKALPDWTFPETFLRLIWLATTSHAGVLDWAVQPLVSCPTGPLTYPGVILTGADSAALTRTGFVDWHAVVAVL